MKNGNLQWFECLENAWVSGGGQKKWNIIENPPFFLIERVLPSKKTSFISTVLQLYKTFIELKLQIFIDQFNWNITFLEA